MWCPPCLLCDHFVGYLLKTSSLQISINSALQLELFDDVGLWDVQTC